MRVLPLSTNTLTEPSAPYPIQYDLYFLACIRGGGWIYFSPVDCGSMVGLPE